MPLNNALKRFLNSFVDLGSAVVNAVPPQARHAVLIGLILLLLGQSDDVIAVLKQNLK